MKSDKTTGHSSAPYKMYNMITAQEVLSQRNATQDILPSYPSSKGKIKGQRHLGKTFLRHEASLDNGHTFLNMEDTRVQLLLH